MALKAEINRLRERIEELERQVKELQNKPKVGRPKKEDARVGA